MTERYNCTVLTGRFSLRDARISFWTTIIREGTEGQCVETGCPLNRLDRCSTKGQLGFRKSFPKLVFIPEQEEKLIEMINNIFPTQNDP